MTIVEVVDAHNVFEVIAMQRKQPGAVPCSG
jgi:hypothetical protein